MLDGCLKTKDKGRNCGAYQIQVFDARSGKLLWSKRPSGKYDPYQVASNSANVIQTDRLYLQLEHELQAINLATGLELWKTPRRWFDDRKGIWYGMGSVSGPDLLAILKIDRRQRLLQTLDPKIGKLRQQATITIPELATTRDLIAANDRTLFIETSGLIPAGRQNSFFDSGTAIVTAYDRQTLQPSFRTSIKSGGIYQMEAIGDSLVVGNYGFRDLKTKQLLVGSLLGMDAKTGRVRWQKTSNQLNCYQYRTKQYQMDADTVYVECGRIPDQLDAKQNSRIVALSTQTGVVKWQTQLSDEFLMSYSPAAMNDRQYLTFRRIKQAAAIQTQAVAIDRQTGKLLWAFPMFDREAVDSWRATVAAQGDRFFYLDRLPLWQIWLLQLNPNWYVR